MVKDFFRLAGRWVVSHSSEILAVTSSALTVTGVVLIIKDADKAHEVIKEEREIRQKSKDTLIAAKEDPTIKYSKIACVRDHLTSYVRQGLKICAKEWKGLVALLFAELSKYGSYILLKREISTISAKFNALSSAFAAYRLRVAGLIGEDKEQMLYEGKEVTANVDGVEKTIPSAEDWGADFACYYNKDEVENNFAPDAATNLDTFYRVQDWVKQQLFIRRDHIVTVDEVKKKLGYNTRNKKDVGAKAFGLHLDADEVQKITDAMEQANGNISSAFKIAGVDKEFFSLTESEIKNFLDTNSMFLQPNNLIYLPRIYS
ncbi:DUF6353 family protein [Segatella bryantii]|uniref:DUF6353 family protein n=1 Tax=Segatella bryantii TaxID=77095 RepID=UPI00242C5AA4|nr:DUF6353 family protein [Segatella bryantii]